MAGLSLFTHEATGGPEAFSNNLFNSLFDAKHGMRHVRPVYCGNSGWGVDIDRRRHELG